MNLNKKIFGWLGVSAMLLGTACTNEVNLQVPDENEDQAVVYGNGSKIVTLTLNSDGNVGTRAVDPDYESHISNGSLADVFIFAIYKKPLNGISLTNDWVLAKEFQKEENRNFQVDGGDVIVLGEGQNALSVNINEYPITIKLSVDEDYSYKIACWAQSSKSTAFITQDLEQVKVIYKRSTAASELDPGMAGPDDVDGLAVAPNNDELRDAFCVSAVIDLDKPNEIVMHRPFAQINVGTTGADYHNILTGQIINPNKRLLYSKVAIKGVANYLDVLGDKILTEDDLTAKGINDVATSNIVFDYSVIPSYYTKNFVLPTAPTYVNYAPYAEEPKALEDGASDDEKAKYDAEMKAFKAYEAYAIYRYYKEKYDSTLLYQDGEELLRVKLNDNAISEIWWDKNDENNGEWNSGAYNFGVKAEDGFFPYKDRYPTVKSYGDDDVAIDVTSVEGLTNGANLYLTEEFKYMSMCYVLAPFSTEDNNYVGSLLDNVTFYFAETQNGTDKTFDGTEYKAGTKLSVNNVPVNRNWRTNILAGLKDTEEPDPDDPTPDGPDDETSLVKTTKLCIHLCPIFTNETNGFNNWTNGITTWTNYTPGTDGGAGEFNFNTNFPDAEQENSWHNFFENKGHE